MNKRDAILNGVRAATELHDKFGLKQLFKDSKERIDVFKIIYELDLPLLFKPLEGLLGAFVKNGEHMGMLVTTNRSLSVQRFTAAHELGHYVLGHKESLDSEQTIMHARQGVANSPLQEIEAETFAGELLMPKWLIIGIAKGQGWSKDDLKNPTIAYQLSLRAGVSYDACCVALNNHSLIDRNSTQALRAIPPKDAKKSILSGVEMTDPWSDVYWLTESDHGAKLYAGPEDTVIVNLPEHSAGGYVWSKPDGVELIRDDREVQSDVALGGVVNRKLVFRGREFINFSIREERPWESESDPIAVFDIEFDFYGKENGLPRVARR